jgi:ABC-type dipeptide/oligopeptide/nickel transport system permease subunit
MRRIRTGIEEAGSPLVPSLVVILLFALACSLVDNGLCDAADPYAR